MKKKNILATNVENYFWNNLVLVKTIVFFFLVYFVTHSLLYVYVW